MANQGSHTPPADRLPMVVRAAAWIGRTVGRWQRHRLARKNDAYVKRWKAAWSAGRDARVAGTPREAAPRRRRSEEREAWLAGWLWANTHADSPDTERLEQGRSHRVSDRALTGPTEKSD